LSANRSPSVSCYDKLLPAREFLSFLVEMPHHDILRNHVTSCSYRSPDEIQGYLKDVFRMIREEAFDDAEGDIFILPKCDASVDVLAGFGRCLLRVLLDSLLDRSSSKDDGIATSLREDDMFLGMVSPLLTRYLIQGPACLGSLHDALMCSSDLFTSIQRVLMHPKRFIHSITDVPLEKIDSLDHFVNKHVHHELLGTRSKAFEAIREGFLSGIPHSLTDYILRVSPEGLSSLFIPSLLLGCNSAYSFRNPSSSISGKELLGSLSVSTETVWLPLDPLHPNTSSITASSLVSSPLPHPISTLSGTTKDTTSSRLLIFSGGSAFDNTSVLLKDALNNISYIMPISDDGGSTREVHE
jgi:hypothetical protein